MGFKFCQNIEFLIAILKVFLAKKQMFNKGKLCSTKCNGMLNSLIKRVQSIPGPLAQLSCGATLHLLLKLCTILGSLVGLNYKSLVSQLDCSRTMIVKFIKYGNFAKVAYF